MSIRVAMPPKAMPASFPCSAASYVELLSSRQTSQVSIERTEGQVTCLAGELEHQTVRESDNGRLAELPESRNDCLSAFDRQLRVVQENFHRAADFSPAKSIHRRQN